MIVNNGLMLTNTADLFPNQTYRYQVVLELRHFQASVTSLIFTTLLHIRQL